jgi:hypothetical protein
LRASLDRVAATERDKFMPILVPKNRGNRVSPIDSILQSVTLV